MLQFMLKAKFNFLILHISRIPDHPNHYGPGRPLSPSPIMMSQVIRFPLLLHSALILLSHQTSVVHVRMHKL